MIERERENQDSEGPNMMVFVLIFKYKLRNVVNGLVGTVATELGGPWGHVPPQNALRYLRVRVTLTLTLTLRHRVSSVLGFLWPDKPLCPPTQQRLPSPMRKELWL